MWFAFERLAVERLQKIELHALTLLCLAGIADVAHAGGTHSPTTTRSAEAAEAGRDRCPLIDRRQEGAAVVGRPAVLQGGTDGDEAGKVLVVRPKAVEGPGAHRRPLELEDARVQLQE